MDYEPNYDDSASVKQTLADLLRGLKKREAWQEVGQGIKNVAKVTPSVVESLGRGAGVQLVPTGGDTSEMLRQVAPQTMQDIFGNRTHATSEEMLAKLPRMTPDYQGSQSHEMMGGVLSPAMPFLLRAGAEATKGMPIGNMIAYHGTPHEIKGGFDLAKIGTGEGAQTYGHGMYFAEAPDVAKTYATPNDQLVPKAIVNNIRQIYDLKVKTGGTSKDAINEAKNQMQYMADNAPTQTVKQLYSDGVNNVERIINNSSGNFYKVDIPDAYIPTMMDYDKPLGQQSAIVKKALNNIRKQITPEMKMELGGDMNLLFGKDITPVQFLNTMEIIHPEGLGIGEKMLNELGVKGMRYLDATSRDAGKGTSNFVVFDPKEVKILEKNSKPVTRKEILEEQINKIEPTITVNDRSIPVTLHPIEARQGNKIEYVNTDKFENAFKKDQTSYIGKGGTENTIGKRYEGVGNFLKDAKSMNASQADVKSNGTIIFGDGRHRFSFLRDQGLSKIPISMDAESIKNAKKFGYID